MNKEEIEKVISEYRRKNLGNPEIYDLVRNDLAYGISKEEVDGYVKDYSLSTSQKEIYSKCLRQRYPINFIQFLMKKVEEQQCPMFIEYFEKGMTVEQLEEVLKQKPQTLAALRSMLQSIYEGLSKVTDDAAEHQELFSQFQSQIDTIIKNFETQENKINQMYQAIEEHKNDDYNREKEHLLKQIAELEQDLENQKNTGSEQTVTIIEMRDERNRLRDSVEHLKEEIQKKDEELQKEREKVEQLGRQIEEKNKEMDTEVSGNEKIPVQHPKTEEQSEFQKAETQIISSKPVEVAYSVTGNKGEQYVFVREAAPEQKKSPAMTLLRKIFLSKRTNRNLMKKVIQMGLNEGQIRQVASGMEKRLSYEQLDILIESKAAPEKMAGIIELAVLENSLEAGC